MGTSTKKDQQAASQEPKAEPTQPAEVAAPLATVPDANTPVAEKKSQDGSTLTPQPADGAVITEDTLTNGNSYHVTIAQQPNGEFTPDRRIVGGVNVPQQGGYTGPLSDAQLDEVKKDKYVKAEEL